MKFVVKSTVFEGPIAILHSMIEERKLSVSEVSLTQITDDFIEFVKEISEESKVHDIYKSELTQFISVASVLILLKSKSLLPESLFEETENRSIELLESQLKAYALMKEAMKRLKTLLTNKPLLSATAKSIPSSIVFIGNPSLNIQYCYEYILSRTHELQPTQEKKLEIRVEKKIKIEDALSHMRTLIKRLKTFNLKSAHQEGDDRLSERNKKTVVILFLAMLELFKLGEIEVEQSENFGEITIVERETEILYT
jgi:segregation and condensation protein A